MKTIICIKTGDEEELRKIETVRAALIIRITLKQRWKLVLKWMFAFVVRP